MDSALFEWNRILEYEQQFSSDGLADEKLSSQFNDSIDQIYQDWSANAEQILQRARKPSARGHRVENCQQLEDAYARISARLKLTPQMLARAAQQVGRGEAIPVQELRNELRSCVLSFRM